MKITLIETGNAKDDPFAQCWYTPGQKQFAVPLLALPVLASLCGNDCELEIIDEKIRELPQTINSDLVCLSFKTKDAKRTYRYADKVRGMGVPVILGGVHASLLPEEAAEHADAVVVGEAEGVWSEVLQDFKNDQLKKIYRAPKGVSLESAPVPRFDLLENDRYWVHAIQTSRGCLVGCEFCPIQKMFGGKSRHKSVDRVMQEVDAVLEIDPDKDIFFVDEMFCGGDKTYQRDLLTAIRERKIQFYCITDFKVIDPEYIWDLSRSGCKKMSINMPGTCLPQELKAVKAIQRLGIDVWGFFMFGFSFHDKTVFQRVVDFVEESDMKNLTLTVMSPFPNTPMEEKVGSNGQIFSRDWDLYDQCHVTYTPERMSAQELEEGFHWAWDTLEHRLPIPEHDPLIDDRMRRTAQRYVGAATLTIGKGVDRLIGREDPPVDLEELLGMKRAEVSITTHNTMGG